MYRYMTKEKAIEELHNLKVPQDIKLIYQDKKYVINPNDINLNYNIEESVEEAYNYGKDGTLYRKCKKIF